MSFVSDTLPIILIPLALITLIFNLIWCCYCQAQRMKAQREFDKSRQLAARLKEATIWYTGSVGSVKSKLSQNKRINYDRTMKYSRPSTLNGSEISTLKRSEILNSLHRKEQLLNARNNEKSKIYQSRGPPIPPRNKAMISKDPHPLIPSSDESESAETFYHLNIGTGSTFLSNSHRSYNSDRTPLEHFYTPIGSDLPFNGFVNHGMSVVGSERSSVIQPYGRTWPRQDPNECLNYSDSSGSSETPSIFAHDKFFHYHGNWSNDNVDNASLETFLKNKGLQHTPKSKIDTL